MEYLPMSFLIDKASIQRFYEIKSQRQIDLEESWWKERITFYGCYIWKPMKLHYESFYTTLSGYWWKHHQLQLGPLVFEWRTRGKKIKESISR